MQHVVIGEAKAKTKAMAKAKAQTMMHRKEEAGEKATATTKAMTHIKDEAEEHVVVGGLRQVLRKSAVAVDHEVRSRGRIVKRASSARLAQLTLAKTFKEKHDMSA